MFFAISTQVTEQWSLSLFHVNKTNLQFASLRQKKTSSRRLNEIFDRREGRNFSSSVLERQLDDTDLSDDRTCANLVERTLRTVGAHLGYTFDDPGVTTCAFDLTAPVASNLSVPFLGVFDSVLAGLEKDVVCDEPVGCTARIIESLDRPELVHVSTLP